jgi:hypothetical protein
MHYPHCQAENRQSRRFCAECVASLASACPSCGFLNEPGEKFCGGCGLPVTAGRRTPELRLGPPPFYIPSHLAEKVLTSKIALEGERKLVTVPFADLRGSMELLADRDPKEARQPLDPVLEHMMAVSMLRRQRRIEDAPHSWCTKGIECCAFGTMRSWGISRRSYSGLPRHAATLTPTLSLPGRGRRRNILHHSRHPSVTRIVPCT